MLERFGIQTRLQLAITFCVIALVVVTTLGGSGGAPPVFFIYRSLLLIITILCLIGCRSADVRIEPLFMATVGASLALMLASVFRIPGSHFEGFYLWYKHAFFVCAFLALAWYGRYQPVRWKETILTAVILLNVIHLIPDLANYPRHVAGFSTNNVNYFGTFLLIGLAGSLAVAVFGIRLHSRIAAGFTAALLFFGITQTWSRGATLAAALMIVVCAVRAGNRIPRQAWVLIGVFVLVLIVLGTPYLVQKFLDLGERDPYNYARTDIWRGALQIIAERPLLGTGFGQYANISKRFTFPADGQLARYLKRAQMAHSEYLQHFAELGIPAAALLLSVLGYLLYLAWKRAETVSPDHRPFHEAAILTAVGVGTHALVDNCWTIPVTASSLVVISLADILPVQQKSSSRRWPRMQLAFAGILLAAVWIHSVLIPAVGFYFNDKGHVAYDKSDYTNAERFHLAAIRIVPNNPMFLDNLGMVYFQQYLDTKQPKLLEPAHQYFAQAIAANPQSLNSYIHMEALLIRSMTGQPNHDLDVYREIVHNNTRFLEIDPFIPFVRKNLAEALYRLGQRDRAFEVLHQAIEYEPNYVPGYLQFSSWYHEMGKDSESKQYERKAVEVVLKYRDFKPRDPYEGILLGRPEQSFMPKPKS